MKGMQQLVHIFLFLTLFLIFRWTSRVTVNISLAYFPIGAIIRKNVDEYTAIVQVNSKFCLKNHRKQNISVAETSLNNSEAKTWKVTRTLPFSFLILL